MRPVTLVAAMIGLLTQMIAVHADDLVYVGTQGVTGRRPAAAPVTPSSAPVAPQGIYAAHLDPHSGALHLIGLVAPVERATWFLLNPTRPVLYSVGLNGMDPKAESTLFSFTLDRRSGALTPLNTVDAGGRDATHLAFDAPSRTLSSANFASGSLTLFPVNADGSLGEVAATQIENGSGPSPRQSHAIAHGVAFDPTHRFVLSADFGADRIFVYRFDAATRSLQPASTPSVSLPAGCGPRRVVFTPDARFLIAACELTAQLHTYAWDARRGELRPIQAFSAYPTSGAGDRSAAELELSRNGRFAYVSLRGDQDGLVVYALNPRRGELHEIQRLSAGGKSPWSFTLSPEGRWLLVADQGSDEVREFRVDAARGTLSMTEQVLQVPQPVAVLVVPEP